MKIADLFAELSLRPDARSFEAGDKLITRIKQGLIGLATYASIQWARGQISQTVELGGAIADLSQKVGIAAEPLQQLGFAAQLSGGSMEGLGNSLGKLSKLAFDAGKGGKEAGEAFRKVGVRVKESDGSLRPVEDLLGDIADHISKLPDGTEKTAKAMSLFGRSGKELIPLLNEGSSGIAKLRQEFVDLGGQMTGEQASALEAYGDEVDKVGVALGGIRNQIVIGVLPHLKELVSGFIEWVKANRALLRQRIEQLLKVLVVAMKVLVKAGMVALDVFSSVVQLFVSWGKMLAHFWENYSLMIAAATGAMIAFKAASIGAAIASAAAWAAPLAAIAAIAILGEDVFSWATGGPSALKDIHEGLVKMFVEAIEFWVKAVEDFFLFFDKKIDRLAKRIRGALPQFLGGSEETDLGVASSLGITGTRANDPELEGIDFFSPEFDAAAERLNAREQSRKEGFRNVADVAINAPITINGTTAQDPNEIARLVQVKLEGIMRTARAATAK